MVAFFFLGVIGYAAGVAIAIPTFLGVSSASTQDVTAQNQTAAAYNEIARTVRSFAAAGAACTSAGGGTTAEVQCLEANDATLAAAFTMYARTIATVDFPSTVRSQASAARSAAMDAGATMNRIATVGPDPLAYRSAVASSNLQVVFNQVDRTFAQLNSALTTSVNQ